MRILFVLRAKDLFVSISHTVRNIENDVWPWHWYLLSGNKSLMRSKLCQDKKDITSYQTRLKDIIRFFKFTISCTEYMPTSKDVNIMTHLRQQVWNIRIEISFSTKDLYWKLLFLYFQVLFNFMAHVGTFASKRYRSPLRLQLLSIDKDCFCCS